MKYLSKKNVVFFGIGVIVLVDLIILLKAGSQGPSESPQQPAQSPAAPFVGYDQFAAFAGERKGTWTNTTFSTKGNVSSDLAIHPDGTASFTMDVGGMVFGLVDPDPKTFRGTYNPQELYFSDHDDLFGDFSISIKPSGEFTMDAPSTEALGIDRFEVNGTITPEHIQAHYQVFLKGGTRSEGVVELR